MQVLQQIGRAGGEPEAVCVVSSETASSCVQGQAGGAPGLGSGALFASLGQGFSPSLGVRLGGAPPAAPGGAGPSLHDAQGPAGTATPRSAAPTEFPMHAEVVAVSPCFGCGWVSIRAEF